jgi:hypothetical protein
MPISSKDIHAGRAQILAGIHGRNWKVAAFHKRAVAGVLAVVRFAAAPSCFFRMDFVAGALHGGFPLDAVKHEKFRLGAEECGVAHA